MSSTKPYNIPLTINKLLLECFQCVDENINTKGVLDASTDKTWLFYTSYNPKWVS